MIPDLVGFRLDKAKEILNTSGLTNYEIQLSSSPWEKEDMIDGNMRVIRISHEEGNKIIILVCK